MDLVEGERGGGETSSSVEGSWAMHIWRLNVLNKIKHFLWRVWTDSLLTHFNLFHQKVASSAECGLCVAPSETLMHVLRDCSLVKQIWIATNLLIGVKVWLSHMG